MDRKLVWTEKASSDIEAIVRYIARRDPSAAARVGLGIYDRAQILLQHPEAGTILDELREGASTPRSRTLSESTINRLSYFILPNSYFLVTSYFLS